MEDSRMEKEVLKLLRRDTGSHVSGQEIARRLGVSRTTIWKTVGALREKGFRIDSSAKRGYRLEGEPERPVDVAIEVGLGTRIIGTTVLSYDSVSSTIDVASALALAGCPEGTVIVAEFQTGGRGRLGRKWSSPAGSGIWTSIILRPAISPREAPKLTLMTAVSVAKVLIERYGIEARIKWPNDVLANGQKICGALTEMVAEQDQVRYVIASFGLNVNQTHSMFPPDIASVATSMLLEAGHLFDRAEVFRAALRELDRLYVCFTEKGGADLLNEWRNLSCTLGRHVRVQLRDGSIEGVARDLDRDGSLLVEVEGGRLETVAYGDVTIVR